MTTEGMQTRIKSAGILRIRDDVTAPAHWTLREGGKAGKQNRKWGKNLG